MVPPHRANVITDFESKLEILRFRERRLHGDHFAGLVWWLLHAHYVTQRTAPLTIAGPAGIAQRFAAAAEALFPKSMEIEARPPCRSLIP